MIELLYNNITEEMRMILNHKRSGGRLMKKRWLALFIIMIMLLGMSVTAHAERYYADGAYELSGSCFVNLRGIWGDSYIAASKVPGQSNLGFVPIESGFVEFNGDFTYIKFKLVGFEEVFDFKLEKISAAVAEQLGINEAERDNYAYVVDFNGVDYSDISSYPVLIPFTRKNNTSTYFNSIDVGNGTPRYIDVRFSGCILKPIKGSETIKNGKYIGTGTAMIHTIFGTCDLGELDHNQITADISDDQLLLSFKAKEIIYNVEASRTNVDHVTGLATFSYEDENEKWNITITPDGSLEGELVYSSERGTMNFTIQLTQ